MCILVQESNARNILKEDIFHEGNLFQSVTLFRSSFFATAASGGDAAVALLSLFSEGALDKAGAERRGGKGGREGENGTGEFLISDCCLGVDRPFEYVCVSLSFLPAERVARA
jgi:hypothetical protein